MRSVELKGIVLSLLALVLSAGAAQAASSGTLIISGIVPLVNDLVITANGTSNTSLNITGGESAKLVANVAETSNNGTGYTITLSSANGGKLKNSTAETSYQMSYNNGPYASPTLAPATVKTVSSLAVLTTNSSPVKVNVTAFVGAPAGIYTDTLTLAIVANP